MKKLSALIALLIFATPELAQTPSQLKRELRQMERAAKKDVPALVDAGIWARDKGLAADAKRIFQRALKIDPDNKGANEALGNEQVEGRWVTAKFASEIRQKLREADFKARGLVRVAGAWVEQERVDDAKKGLFHFDGDYVTKAEYLALTGDMVRHPVTGSIIAAKDLEKAEQGLFPIGSEGRWVSEKDANRHHIDRRRPWVVRTNYCNVISTLPIGAIEELRHPADRGVERVRPIFGLRQPPPSRRPTIVVASTMDEFNEWGNEMGDEASAFGVFLVVPDGSVRLAMVGAVRPVITWREKDWVTRYVQHAAGMAYAASMSSETGDVVPLWMLHGFGTLAGRFDNDADAAWFGKQFQAKGGIKNVSAWFNSFAISGDMQPTDIEYNIYHSGLVISFAAEGGNDEALTAMQAFGNALATGKSKTVAKSVANFEKVLSKNDEGLRRHLQMLIKKGG